MATEWITTSEAQKVVQCFSNTIYFAIRSGEIRAKKPESNWLIDKASLLTHFKGKAKREMREALAKLKRLAEPEEVRAFLDELREG